jgi:hypothetical protein
VKTLNAFEAETRNASIPFLVGPSERGDDQEMYPAPLPCTRIARGAELIHENDRREAKGRGSGNMRLTALRCVPIGRR